MNKMKRPPPPPPPLPPPPPPSYSSSSSSSSSCINSPKTQKRSQPKRVRTKKIQNADGDFAASAKSRSSIFRGVTRHRWTGRFEAHLWDKSTWNSLQNKKGRQIYLGAYDKEESAARTYDLAALKYWGPGTPLNFPIEKYLTEIEEMKKLSKEEYLASLRRRSSGFSRGVSKYRGVARHHHNGRWEARIGRVSGNKYLYLGTYNTQEEAAAAYDMAAIEFRGPNAVTNFDISHYKDKLRTFPPETEIKQEDVQAMNQETLQLVPETHSDETIDHQDDQMVEPSVPKLELIDSITEDIEHPWNDLCLDLDLGGFNSFQIPNIPLDKPNELMGLLDDKGFDDEIDFIFDNELLQDAMSGTTAERKDVEENILVTSREEKASLTMTSSSPPSTSTSTSTSVGSNI